MPDGYEDWVSSMPEVPAVSPFHNGNTIGQGVFFFPCPVVASRRLKRALLRGQDFKDKACENPKLVKQREAEEKAGDEQAQAATDSECESQVRALTHTARRTPGACRIHATYDTPCTHVVCQNVRHTCSVRHSVHIRRMLARTIHRAHTSYASAYDLLASYDTPCTLSSL